MSTLGKMSVGIFTSDAIPKITISSAATTKVYGRNSAILTSHIGEAVFVGSRQVDVQ